MKTKLSIPCFLLLLLTACKTEKKSDSTPLEKEQSILEKVAYAHGFQHWKNVTKLQFTFNVERDTSHFERSWVWYVKTNDVLALSGQDTLRYNRRQMDSVALKTNGGFINDKYWLMAPYNLVWDKANFTYKHHPEALAPISNKPMQKLTIVYGNEGGYTPGDAYDFFFENDFLVKEWNFRRGNADEPSMSTTWEANIEANGLVLSTVHNNAEGNFKLHFTGIVVEAN
ncbi:hypothetical protein U1E44_11330 [Arenibacter sp. GZD96]|uniref:hypothetical protein n=1 Tax=Aurantibrevibacter litoralis TaxID=3106030 RepID=UPI002B002DEF|nr:hypothetical protein [Arenibacter sp. GZD-96]MEA1786686.1 hypothetical protein [Arenibacter sp. GZD-96]